MSGPVRQIEWLLTILLGGLGGLIGFPAIGDDSPPNIVFVLADDLGYGDLACYGHPYARTPHLDRLAAEGTQFRQFYVTGVTCCPSRTGFMTGRFPARFQRYMADYGFGDRVTVTQLLKEHGYATGHFGKWHMGPTTRAGTYGIDEISEGDADRRRTRRERGRDAALFDAAIDFIERHRDESFYVNVWAHSTHFPVNPPEAYVTRFQDLIVNESNFSDYMQDKFADCRARGGNVNLAMRNYMGDVSALDDEVGRLLTKLDELELTANTIVVFSSDHGPAPVEAPARAVRRNQRAGNAANEQYRVNMLGYAGGLRGGKHGDYEGGVRVPFLIRWPGHVPAGRVDASSVISGIDWLPTLCGITGAGVTADDLDGENVAAAWLGLDWDRTKPLYWKTNAAGSDAALREGKWKLHGSRRGAVELYDLVEDPGERTNVADAHPQVVTTLTHRLEAWTSTLPTTYEKSTAADN